MALPSLDLGSICGSTSVSHVWNSSKSGWLFSFRISVRFSSDRLWISRSMANRALQYCSPRSALDPALSFSDITLSASSNFLRACALSYFSNNAHARRKFDEALKSIPEKSRAGSLAMKGKHYCDRLFVLERKYEELST